jgi:hypothetical protein
VSCVWRRRGAGSLAGSLALIGALASCGTGGPAVPVPGHGTAPRSSPASIVRPSRDATADPAAPTGPLPVPAALTPFSDPAMARQGTWSPAGRLVGGRPAVYVTMLVPPGGTQAAGIAWMDTSLLSARLYSGSRSPGEGPYRFTAPIERAQAATLVAAFNGGFLLNTGGGYYTEGRPVYPLRREAASLVIYADGSLSIGAWGSDVVMTPSVVSVRQNLMPLVSGGRPAPLAASADWQAWGNTCGATSCAASVPGIEHQWRSGVGVTADGALVYAAGPALAPLQLARLLVRAGAVRGMQLDINPYWPDFVTYNPAARGGLAAPSDGSKLLPSTVQGPATFFEPLWARDFITMSARPVS